MIPRIKKILYATDLTKNSAYAFRYAVNSAQKHEAEIHILHVVETMSPQTQGLLALYMGPDKIDKLHDETKRNLARRIEERLVEFARSLAMEPQLLLLDEPLLGLSPLMEAMLARSVRDINLQTGITILISEQYARPILPIIHHGYILENGGAVLEGNSQELMDNPDVKSAYFGL